MGKASVWSRDVHGLRGKAAPREIPQGGPLGASRLAARGALTEDLPRASHASSEPSLAREKVGREGTKGGARPEGRAGRAQVLRFTMTLLVRV